MSSVVKLSRWQQVMAVISSLSIFLLAIGEYKNIKDLSVEVYALVLKRFTHQLEYEKLSRIRVGISKSYLQAQVGHAKAIKPSKKYPQYRFEYYFEQKYLLTAIFDGDRMSCYSVLALEDDFKPPIALSTFSLNEQLVEQVLDTGATAFDNGFANVRFMLQQQSLGNAGLFLYRSIGRVEYQNASKSFDLLLNDIEKAGTDDDDALLQRSLQSFNETQQANYFALCDEPLPLVVKSILSSLEYQHLK